MNLTDDKQFLWGSNSDLERRRDKYEEMARGERPLEHGLFRADCWAIVEHIDAELARRTTVQ